MNAVKGCIYGAETLVRWNYKHKALLPPYHFEADDSIIKVDNRVLRKVCEKLKEWKENLSKRRECKSFLRFTLFLCCNDK